MEPLKRLMDLCKCCVAVRINDHRNQHKTAADSLRDQDTEDVPPDVLAEMIARDTIIRVTAYPSTPVGFYVSLHWDLDAAVGVILEAVEDEMSRVTVTASPVSH